MNENILDLINFSLIRANWLLNKVGSKEDQERYMNESIESIKSVLIQMQEHKNTIKKR